LIAGIFFLLTFVHVAILPLYDDILNDPDFILGAGDDTAVRLGAIFDLVTALCGIATGVVLFQALRYQQLGIALGYVAVRTFEALMIVSGTLCLLAIVTLREDFTGTTGAEAANLSAIGSAFVAFRDWTFFFGPGLCAGLGNGLLLGYLMLRSGLVPRNMALLGVIGGPLSLVGLVFVLFGQWSQTGEAQFLFTLGEIAWELSLSVYLIVKGFKPSPITARLDSGELEPEPLPVSLSRVPSAAL
jgi:hypothetical protein